MKNSNITILTVGGAFTAYCIGAGFASGQETLQFFGAFGGMYPFILPVTCSSPYLCFYFVTEHIVPELLNIFPIPAWPIPITAVPIWEKPSIDSVPCQSHCAH